METMDDQDNVEVMTWTVTIDHSCAPHHQGDEETPNSSGRLNGLWTSPRWWCWATSSEVFFFFYQIIKINKIEVLNVCVILCLRQVSMSSQSDDVKPDQRWGAFP